MTPEQIEKKFRALEKAICCNSGTTEFTLLTDGPGAFAGHAGESVRVNVGETALEYFVASGGGMTNPLTTTGDIIYSSSGTTPARLGIGANGEFLKSNGTIPEWDSINVVVTPTGTGSNVLFDVGTDILYHRRLGSGTFIDVTTELDDTISFDLSATGTPDSTTFLRGDGTWATPAGGVGDVIKVGTPVNDQIGVWTGNGTIEGTTALTFDNTQLTLNATAIASTGETLFRINLSDDANAFFSISNATGTDARFSPAFIGQTGSASNQVALSVFGQVLAAVDSGTTPVVVFDARRTSAALTTRPLFSFRNFGTEVIGVAIGGVTTFSGNVIGLGGFQTVATISSASVVTATGSTALNIGSSSTYIVESAGATSARLFIGGATNYTIPASTHNYGTVVIGGVAVTEFTSGNHPLISGLILKAPVITGGTATTTNLATLYIDAAPSGITPTGRADAIRVAAGNVYFVNGNLDLGTAGNKINITTGSNASIGVSATMTAGSITISTTAVTTNSKIFLTHASLGGTQGILSVGTITNGTSFVINSSSGTDTGTVNWWIIN